MNMGRTKDGFTLMELMVVIAIMAVIMGITIPAFTTMGKGSGMRGAIAQLRSTISLSRQWAVTHRAKTYILFPYVSSPDFIGNKNYAQIACRAYAVYAVTNIVTTNGEFVTDWRFLPSDIVFEEDPEHPDATGHKDVFDVQEGELITVPLNGKDSEFYAIIFKPDGSPGGFHGGMGYELWMREGYVNLDTNNLSNSDYGFKPNGLYMSVEVAGNHGGIKIHDRNQ